MARTSRERVRSGFRGVRKRQGRFDRYLDVVRNEEISRRQYLKRTENLKSLEEKSGKLKAAREKYGVEQPLTRYNDIVRQYKKANPGAKVRGPKGKEFRAAFAKLKRGFSAGLKGRLQRADVLYRLGIISKRQKQEYEKDAYEEFSTDDLDDREDDF